MFIELSVGQPVELDIAHTMLYGGVFSSGGRMYASLKFNFVLDELEQSHLVALSTQLLGKQTGLPVFQPGPRVTQVLLQLPAGSRHGRTDFLCREVAKRYGEWLIQHLSDKAIRQSKASKKHQPAEQLAVVAFLPLPGAALATNPAPASPSRTRRAE
ncbi:MAG TPA: hypothetical protein VFH39_03930, partial [Candidatus Saccharimonadales bacterium]|nr:hypothetical protein [Candidatus Saccharimonadales bacterium]